MSQKEEKLMNVAQEDSLPKLTAIVNEFVRINPLIKRDSFEIVITFSFETNLWTAKISYETLFMP